MQWNASLPADKSDIRYLNDSRHFPSVELAFPPTLNHSARHGTRNRTLATSTSGAVLDNGRAPSSLVPARHPRLSPRRRAKVREEKPVVRNSFSGAPRSPPSPGDLEPVALTIERILLEEAPRTTTSAHSAALRNNVEPKAHASFARRQLSAPSWRAKQVRFVLVDSLCRCPSAVRT
jgi:hypothetical protein